MSLVFVSCGIPDSHAKLQFIYDDVQGSELSVQEVGSSGEYILQACSIISKIRQCVTALENDDQEPVTFTWQELSESFTQKDLDLIYKIGRAYDNITPKNPFLLLSYERYSRQREKNRDKYEFLVQSSPEGIPYVGIEYDDPNIFRDLPAVFEMWPYIISQNPKKSAKVPFVYPMIVDIARYLRKTMPEKEIESYCIPALGKDTRSCKTTW